MNGRRLGRGTYLGAWFALTALQAATWVLLAERPVMLVGSLIALVQLAKVPVAAARARDMGISPDEGLKAVLPIANIQAWFGLLGAHGQTPENEMSGFDALALGFRSMLSSAAVGLSVCLVASVGVVAATEALIDQLLPVLADPTRNQVISQATVFAAVLLFGYLVLQIVNRSTATRKSWFPTLFLPSLLLLALAPALVSRGAEEFQLVVLLAMSFRLAWGMVIGAFAVLVFVLLTENRRTGDDDSPVLSTAASRLMDFAPAYGAKTLVVFLGMQIIVPGIYYALQFAFVEMVAVARPETASLRRSRLLTRGIRIKLFRVFWVWALVATLGGLIVGSFFDTPEALMTFQILPDPRVVSFQTRVATDLSFALATWWVTAAMVWLYHDREAAIVKLREARQAGAPVEAPGPA